MTRQRFFLASLLPIGLGMVLACGGSGNRSGPPQQETDKFGSSSKSASFSWASPDKAIRQGDLQVQIAKVTIGKVPLKELGRQTASKDKLLMIKLQLLNTNPTKKVEHRSWAGADFSLGDDYATLKDNFGNDYQRISFGITTVVIGGVMPNVSESIFPDKPLTDVLVFEVPLDSATHLDLEMPASNYKCEGTIRFRIPMKSVSRE